MNRLKLVLIFIPVIVTLLYVHAFTVELPLWDDWEFVATLSHIQTGGLEWRDIDMQRNEARIFFPQLTYLTLATVAGYSVHAFVYASYACLSVSLLILYAFFARIRAATGIGLLYFLPVSLLFVTWRQYHGMLWAAHLPNTMSLMFVLAALYFCMHSREIPICFPAAIVCAFIASFSMGSGLMTWPLGLAYFLFFIPREGPDFVFWIRRACIWVVAAAVCAAVYLVGYVPHVVPWPTGFGYVLAHPLEAVEYTLTYLGSPLSATAPQALDVGLAVAICAVPLLFFTIRDRKLRDLLFPALALLGLIALAMIPVLNTRLALGVPQAFSSHYVTMQSIAIIGLYFCVLVLGEKTRWWHYARIACVGVLCLGIINSYNVGLKEGKLAFQERNSCAGMLKSYRERTDAELTCMYPNADVVRLYAPTLELRHFSVFHE